MELDRLAIVARARRPWEAIDLGIVMARTWFPRLFWSWFIPSSALLFLLDLVPFLRGSTIGLLVVWWLKPFWDRLPLYVASRALFGEQVRIGAALRAFPVLARRDWIPWLLWRRFSPSRSFDLPVTVLESLQGDARAERIAILHVGSGSAASGLTIACAHFELVLVAAVFIGSYLLIPAELGFDFFDWIVSDSPTASWLEQWVVHGAAALVAPFYTMGGFALYLDRRIELEAWDVEIRFRHLAERSSGSARAVARLAKGGLAAAVVLFALVGSTSRAEEIAIAETTASAQTTTPTEAPAIDDSAMPIDSPPAAADPRLESRAAIEEILEGDAFHRTERKQGWRLASRDSKKESEELVPDWLIAWFESFEAIARWIDAQRESIRTLINGLELLGGGALLALAGFLLHRHREVVRRFLGRSGVAESEADQIGPEVLIGLDVRAAAIPADVPREVLQLAASGRSREALALLYRATLSRLVARAGLRFSEGHTEEQCLAIVRRGADARLAEFFLELTRCWQRMAYGHREPGTAELERLCAGFAERLHV
ncbi:MAG: DUF4129 domain-containing protein [Myxococcota bacterium]